MRAIAYLRVSTDEQADSGAGLAAQRAACASWAERQGAALEVRADEGVSGAAAIDARPALLEAIGMLRAGDVLLVARRDRLARDPIVAAMVERLAARAGARVVSAAGEGTDGEAPTDVLMRRIVDAFAEYERLVIGARTKAALRAIRVSGRKTGGEVPYGYQLGADGRTLEAFEPEQRVLAKVRELRAAGFSLRAVSKMLADAGLLARTGRPFAPTQVARMEGAALEGAA
jgi:DNA invertase Pin-like site-specific DNA recombinase